MVDGGLHDRVHVSNMQIPWPFPKRASEPAVYIEWKTYVGKLTQRRAQCMCVQTPAQAIYLCARVYINVGSDPEHIFHSRHLHTCRESTTHPTREEADARTVAHTPHQGKTDD